MIIQPNYWHKMDANVPPELAPIGSVTTFSNPIFSPCKFGNGLDDTDGDVEIFATITQAVRYLKGSVSFWYKAGINGPLSSGGVSQLFGQTGANLLLYLFAYGAYYGMFCYAIDYNAVYCFALDWLALELMHLAFTWDGTASAGQRLKCYKNNVPVGFAPAGILADFAWSTDGYYDIVTGYPPYNPMYGIMDNLKFYPDVLTDFSWDMAHEGLQPSGSRRMLHRPIIN